MCSDIDRAVKQTAVVKEALNYMEVEHRYATGLTKYLNNDV